MYDVNPLGPLAHLKELERQAIAIAARKSGEDRPSAFAWLPKRLANLWRWIAGRPDAGERLKPSLES